MSFFLGGGGGGSVLAFISLKIIYCYHYNGKSKQLTFNLGWTLCCIFLIDWTESYLFEDNWLKNFGISITVLVLWIFGFQFQICICLYNCALYIMILREIGFQRMHVKIQSSEIDRAKKMVHLIDLN